VLIVGGDHGMPGALRLAGEAALRSGAGLVSLATRPAHAAGIPLTRPELMCHGVQQAAQLAPLLKRATVVAVGPGLGTGEWGRGLFGALLDSPLSLVVDADALNLLAREPLRRGNWILTPHPGEAARLLGIEVAEVEKDRFAAVRALSERYGGTVVLKGAGTLIHTEGHPVAVCDRGNPGMASGGMGDVLTGVIAALRAQGLDDAAAAEAGVWVHAAAGDRAAQEGERGLLAGDLMAALRAELNPHAV
jgi:NAD(P)H-hydrate epimerase